MTPTRHGSIRLFRFAGIDVFLHWSWFLVAAFLIDRGTYSSVTWSILEYVALFAIVLMHEFGHSLACRQVGGQANQIVLWPLGGVAYVNPPQRPGATLWSIVAGPLVNVVLFPILSVLLYLSVRANWGQTSPDFPLFLQALWYINLLLLVFNLMPVYPLDGGQILRSLLWFVVGRARSLMIATTIGFIGAGLLLAGSIFLYFGGAGVSGFQPVWFVIMAVFMIVNCWSGLVHARMLARAANAPRHEGFACPKCKAVPPQGNFWLCGQCRKPFDSFVNHATCTNCGAEYGASRCLDCGGLFSIYDWMVSPTPPVIFEPAAPPPFRPGPR